MCLLSPSFTARGWTPRRKAVTIAVITHPPYECRHSTKPEKVLPLDEVQDIDRTSNPFLIATKPNADRDAPFTVVLNWQAALKSATRAVH
jgi:hypothetical protein